MTDNRVMQQAFDDLRWAHKNEELQEKYEGQIVVLHQRTVIAYGVDEEAVLAEVDKWGLSPEEVVVVNMMSADFEAPPDMDP